MSNDQSGRSMLLNCAATRDHFNFGVAGETLNAPTVVLTSSLRVRLTSWWTSIHQVHAVEDCSPTRCCLRQPLVSLPLRPWCRSAALAQLVVLWRVVLGQQSVDVGRLVRASVGDEQTHALGRHVVVCGVQHFQLPSRVINTVSNLYASLQQACARSDVRSRPCLRSCKCRTAP